MKQNEKTRAKNPNHDENCKIAGEKMKTSEEEGGERKKHSQNGMPIERNQPVRDVQ